MLGPITILLLAACASAFPGSLRSRSATPHHRGSAPDVSAQYPYANSVGGKPGTNFGGWLVPADGDVAHAWEAPLPGDITGPCPGGKLGRAAFNNLARYGFIRRDGRTTFDELVSGAVNMWNMGYDMAVFLVAAEFSRNGDIQTQRITIGAPDLSWANSAGMGNHGSFEQDASISREDMGISGDAVNISMAAYQLSSDICGKVSGGLWDFDCMVQVRKQKYDRGVAHNPSFVFGPMELILYGAASHLYELFPSGAHGTTPANPPDGKTMDMIFGVIPNKDRTAFEKDIEWVPKDWWTRNAPYTLPEIAVHIARMYAAAPVPFGGNAGRVNSFDVIVGSGFRSGIPIDQTPEGLFCLLGNALLQNDFGASGSGGVLGTPLDPVRRAWTAAKLGPVIRNAFTGCVLLHL